MREHSYSQEHGSLSHGGPSINCLSSDFVKIGKKQNCNTGRKFYRRGKGPNP